MVTIQEERETQDKPTGLIVAAVKNFRVLWDTRLSLVVSYQLLRLCNGSAYVSPIRVMVGSLNLTSFSKRGTD